MNIKHHKFLASLLAIFMLITSISSAGAFVFIDSSNDTQMNHNQHQTMNNADDVAFSGCCSACELNGVCDSNACNMGNIAILSAFSFDSSHLQFHRTLVLRLGLAKSSPDTLFRPPRVLS